MKEILYLTSISCIEDTLSPKEPEVGIMWHTVCELCQTTKKSCGQEARMPAYVMRGEDLGEEVNVNFYFECDNFILILRLRMGPLLCGSDGWKRFKFEP